MEEIYKARYVGRGRALPALTGHATVPVPPPVHQPGSSSNPLLLGFCGGFLMEAWSIIYSISSPLPSLEGGNWGWKFQASNHDLVFRVTSPHPTQSHLIKTRDAPSAFITQKL